MWTCLSATGFILKKKIANMADRLQRSGNEKFMPVITTHLKGITAKTRYEKSSTENALILDLLGFPPLYQNEAAFFLPLYHFIFSHPLISPTLH